MPAPDGTAPSLQARACQRAPWRAGPRGVLVGQGRRERLDGLARLVDRCEGTATWTVASRSPVPGLRRDPAPLDAQHTAARRTRRDPELDGLAPSVGTWIVAPSAASTNVTGTSTRRFCPSRSNTGCLRTCTVTTRSPPSPPSGRLLAAAPQPDLLPVRDPRRDLDLRRPAVALQLTVSPAIAVGEVERRVAVTSRPSSDRRSRGSRRRPGRSHPRGRRTCRRGCPRSRRRPAEADTLPPPPCCRTCRRRRPRSRRPGPRHPR